jgi:hypothetical protein
MLPYKTRAFLLRQFISPACLLLLLLCVRGYIYLQQPSLPLSSAQNSLVETKPQNKSLVSIFAWSPPGFFKTNVSQ